MPAVPADAHGLACRPTGYEQEPAGKGGSRDRSVEGDRGGYRESPRGRGRSGRRRETIPPASKAPSERSRTFVGRGGKAIALQAEVSRRADVERLYSERRVPRELSFGRRPGARPGSRIRSIATFPNSDPESLGAWRKCCRVHDPHPRARRNGGCQPCPP